MAEAIDGPREKLSQHAPAIESIKIDPEKIGAVIGKGGETIRALCEEFEAEIDVEDDGTVRIYAPTGELVEACVARIKSMTKEAEIGDRYDAAKVVKTTTFGAFVELVKGTDGLLHISNVKPGERVDSVDDVLNAGEEIDVTVVEVDKERGRIGLRLSDDPSVAGKSPEELASVGSGGDGGGGRRNGGDRGRGGGGDRGRGGDRGGRRRDASSATRLSGARLTELDSGVRVVTEEVPSVRSVALGLWVRTGSRNETPAQAGVSHFLEHLLFKGTARYSAIEISERFDGLGASVNAATGKETTHLHARFLDEHTEEVFDLLAEMLLAPTYPEIDSERQVVLEEIAMYEDEPQDRVHDVLAEAVFGEHPLGRRVLGEAEVIASIPVPDIEAYRSARYTGPGDRRRRRRQPRPRAHRRAGRSASSIRRPADGEATGRQPRSTGGSRLCFHRRRPSSTTSASARRGCARDDERRYALAVLDSIFGGSTSSRLFREVREKRGLAYSVGSYNEQFTDQGLVATYVGTREDNVEEACSIIGTELARLRSEPVSDEELARAKESVKGRLVLSSESTAARMTADLPRDLFGLPIESLDEMLAKVDAVAVDDLTELAHELYGAERLSAACVGADESRFREALAPVSETLVAA